MAIERFYISCSRLRPTTTLNAYNRPIKTYTETSINGYLGSSSDIVIKVADKETFEARSKFYCDDFDLESTDLIKYEGNTYEIIGEPRNTVHRSHHVRATVKMIGDVKQE
jgi:hypothetical protein